MYQSLVETVGTSIIMITRPLILVIVCFGFLILLQSLVPKVMALQRSSKVNEFTLEDQRTRKRKNYVIQLARENERPGKSELATNYDAEPFQYETNPEGLSAFIVDYANMIRNDVILLDNSVETRTQKRGNIKVKKFNQALPDPPCSCNTSRVTKDFGENIIPRYIESNECSSEQQTCVPPYICKEHYYNLTVLRRRDTAKQTSTQELPIELRYKWVTEKLPISVSCTCVRDYILENYH